VIEARRTFLLLCLFAIYSLLGYAQNGNPAQLTDPHGDQPFGTYQVSDIDQIGFANGSLDVRIPLFLRHGRGLAHEKYFHFTNKNWYPDSGPFCDSSVMQCPPPIIPTWAFADNSIQFSYTTQYPSPCGRGGFGSASEYTDFTYIDEAGTPHKFDVVVSRLTPPPTCIHQKLKGYAIDGSGMMIDVTDYVHPIVTLKDGTRVQDDQHGIPSFLHQDTNGNMITVDGVVSTGAVNGEFDTLGRDVRTVITTGLPNNGSYEDWITKDQNGNDQITRIEWAYAQVSTNFQQSGIQEAAPSIRFAQKIDLPNGLSYRFTYDTGSSPGHYGELIRIDLPAGGYVRYEYAPISTSSILSAVRSVTTRAVSVDGTSANEKVWTYSYQLGVPGIGFNTTTVTDPDGNQTVHVTIDALLAIGNFAPLEVQTKYYQGTAASGRLLKTVSTDYNTISFLVGDGDTTVSTRYMNRPIRVTTTLDNGLVSKVETDYDPQPDNNGVISYSRSNVIERREYDFGQGAPGPLVRRTTYTYLHNANSAYATANIVDKVLNTTVYDGAGNIVAQTQNGYDETALANTNASSDCHSPIGAPNHDYCNFGVGNTTRGNLTSVRHWRNTDNTWLPTAYSYDDLGNIISATDPGGHTTNYSFSDSWSGASCTPTGMNTYAFLTQITNPLNQRTQASYYSCPGLIQSKRDENDIRAGRTGTTFTYDPINRLLTATAPDGGSTSFNYHGDALPLTITKTEIATPDPSIISSVIYDGLGRVKTTSLDSDPLGADIVDTTYDNLGRKLTVSNPHRAASAPTDGITSTTYDALGRVTQVTKQDGSISKVQYDVPTTIALNANCTISTDEAGNPRGACTDALGRLVEVDEPNPGATFNVNNHATLQQDGNFVLYSSANNSLWASNTSGSNASSIMMQDDGNLVLYIFKWSAGTYAAPTPGSYPPQTCSIGSYLASGQRISSNQCIVSPHGQYMLYMASDGNFYIYDMAHGVATWSANTYSHPGAYAILQSDGNFVVYATNGVALWNSGTAGTYSERLDLEDDGRIIIYKSAWNSGTSTGQFNWTQLAHPGCDAGTGTGLTGVLGSGQCFVSPNGHFELLLQADGNLVINDLGSNPASLLWASNTAVSPADPGFAMRTLYTYDALGNLLRVEQHGGTSDSSQWRIRNFTYNSLSQLLTATNPESGTITYSYDADGNLLQKTSPAPNQTGTATQTISYCYDALHRVMGKAYGAFSCPLTSPVVSYTYDAGNEGVGHMTSLIDQAGSASYTYDLMGRIHTESRTISGQSKNLSYGYDLSGFLTSITYPSQTTVNYTSDAAGHVVSAIDMASNIQYVTGASYGPDGAITGFISGSSASFAGITNSFSYNKRMQPVTMSAASSAQTVFSIGYDFHLGSGNNGNVWNLYNYKDRNRDQTFTYDALNRLTSAQNAGTDCSQKVLQNKTEYWGNSYSYDAWGNLLNKTVTKCGAENLAVTADMHNWIHSAGTPDYQYDAAGNMTFNATAPTQTYTYDQENRLTGAAGYTYTYDADGNRVKKANGSAGTLYWYMTPGIVAESDLNGNLTSEYVFFGGERVARRDFAGGTTSVAYYFSDYLKTASIITNASGTITAESDYYPWGGELQFVANDSNHYKFTGKERDTETGLDYFGARYYSNGLGRFITPDWAAKATAVPYAEFSDPQSLNLYGYVRNLPTTRYDAEGHCPAGDTNCKDVKVQVDPPTQKAVVASGHVNNGKNTIHVVGVGADITGTVTVKDKTIDGVKVTETNKEKRTINGKDDSRHPIEHNDVTKNGGKYTDSIGYVVETRSAKEEAAVKKSFDKVQLTQVDTQKLTLTFPDGATCNFTSTRTLTNIDSNGKQTDYTVTTTQPVAEPK
jgi:RHS repeat-associated protein